jgi:hypothetical protein
VRLGNPGPPFGVDRDHDALGAEDPRELGDQLGPLERRRVDRDLVGARVQHGLRVLDRADPSADRERDEDVVGRAAGELDDRVAALVRGGDVEEDQLVGTLRVVALGELHRVAGVTDVDEVRALDDATVVDVQTGNDPLQDHVASVATRTEMKEERWTSWIRFRPLVTRSP